MWWSMSERATPHVRKFLGQRLRTLRKRRNLSQEGLGKQAGLSSRFISGVEHGEMSISIDSLYRVSVALRVPLSLLTSVGPSPRSVPTVDAERILALVLDGKRGQSIHRAHEVLRMMLRVR